MISKGIIQLTASASNIVEEVSIFFNRKNSIKNNINIGIAEAQSISLCLNVKCLLLFMPS